MPVGPYEDHAACVADNQEMDDPDAFCAWLEQQAATLPTSEHSGAVVTLLPTVADADRLIVAGGDPPADLHVTLAWLGEVDGDPAPADTFEATARAVADRLFTAGAAVPVTAEVFAHAVFNPDDDEREPATVLLIQSEGLAKIHGLIGEAVEDVSSFPVWMPHLTLGYNLAPLTDEQAAARMGPVTFDRVAISYGTEQALQINLGDEPMTASTKPRRVRVVTGGRTVTASTTGCAPCAGFADDLEMPEPVEVGDVGAVEPGATWTGVLAVEGTPTGDGRMFEPGALRWEGLPLPLRWVRQDEGEHLGAVVVGRILEVWREGRLIRGRGDFDAGSADGREAARQVREQLTRGVSVDVDDVDMEIRVAGDVLDEMEQPVVVEEDDLDGEEEVREEDADGRVTVIEFGADDELMVMTDARLRASTIVATAAFVEAMLDMDDDQDQEIADAEEEEEEADEPADVAVTAGATRAAPPADWFADPALTEPTPVTITDDGRIFGHIAAWGTCHTAYAHECVSPPTSPSSYAYFRTGAVRTADGQTVPTGRITLDTTHAGRRLGSADTVAHYEHTGRGAADVAAGEDAHGIWIAGAVRPSVADEELAVLAASPLSGDWRRIAGALELVHVLAVNSPGFPVPRALVAGGAVQTLQSAGVIDRPAIVVGSSDDDRLLARLLERERRDEQARRAAAEDAHRRVLVASAVARVRGR